MARKKIYFDAPEHPEVYAVIYFDQPWNIYINMLANPKGVILLLASMTT